MKCALVACVLLLVSAAATARASSEIGRDLVVNGGFEGGSAGWRYMATNAVGSGAVDTTIAHSGKASFKLTNRSAFGPHVYHRVWQTMPGLSPYTTYRISAWVKGAKSGIAWIGGGPAWTLRKPFPKGDFDWTHVTVDYTTGHNVGDFDLMVVTESETEGLWVDDVKMEVVAVDREKLERVTKEFDATRLTLERRVATLKEQFAPDRASDPYVTLGLSVAERYLQRLQPGVWEKHQSRGWSVLQLQEIASILDETEKLAAKRPASDGVLPWPGDAPASVSGGLLLAKTGSAERRPWFFYGYGHFDQPFKDLPFWRNVGVSLIQEGRVGPSAMGADGKLLENARRSVADMKRAAEHGVRVDWLISPHYFPEWALQQAPDLRNGNGGFLGNNIDHPLGREVNRRWLDAMLTELKGTTSLLSLCLSNEPVYMMSGHDPYSRPKFAEYLAERHGGDVASLNALYGTAYKSFTDVPVPAHGLPEGVEKLRAYYDWCRFNMQNFADWHAWLAGVAKEHRPDLSTHAKVMAFFSFDRDKLHWGVDPELMCAATDLAGCDAYAFPSGDLKGFDWHGHAFWYDLLHSFRGQPVFNSENHLIPDGFAPGHIPPAITRAQLWQGGLHHQAASTTWVWEENSHPHLSGSIYFRPGNVWAAGRAMLDLNRLADEVAAINRARPRVAILYSPTSVFWEPKYAGAAHGLYNLLNFSGERVTFVSERQFAEGRAAKGDAILIPRASHVTDAAIKGLEAFVAAGGQVLRLGDDALPFDEAPRPRALPSSLKSSPTLALDAKDEAANAEILRKALRSTGLTLHPLTKVPGDEHPWAVEYRVVARGAEALVPMINYHTEPQTVRLTLGAKGEAVDLLSGEAVDLANLSLPPLEPRLIRVRR